ncbi:MAG: hypothetical protein P4L73_12215 [Caulobacteraceae bacterium]|nr:hypothetical protein [Caulobacteraceae bacterium]
MRIFALAAFSAALFGGASVAAPASMAPADVLLAQAKAATGGPAWDRLQGWHERGVDNRPGQAIAYEAWIDLRSLAIVNVHTVDEVPVTRGGDGRTTWVIDPAGGVQIDPNPQAVAGARRSAYFSAYGFFFPDRLPARRAYVGPLVSNGATYDVVRVTPGDGAPMDIWIDRATHRVTAFVDPDRRHPTIALLADFRPVDGVLLPHTVAQSGGGVKPTSVEHVAAYDFNPAEAGRFTPPAP